MAKLVGMNGVESLVSLLLQQASHAAAANRAAQHRAPGQLRAEGVSPDSSQGVLAQVRLAQGEHLQLWYAVTALTPHALLREAGELGCSVAGDQSCQWHSSRMRSSSHCCSSSRPGRTMLYVHRVCGLSRRRC